MSVILSKYEKALYLKVQTKWWCAKTSTADVRQEVCYIYSYILQHLTNHTNNRHKLTKVQKYQDMEIDKLEEGSGRL